MLRSMCYFGIQMNFDHVLSEKEAVTQVHKENAAIKHFEDLPLCSACWGLVCVGAELKTYYSDCSFEQCWKCLLLFCMEVVKEEKQVGWRSCCPVEADFVGRGGVQVCCIQKYKRTLVEAFCSNTTYTTFRQSAVCVVSKAPLNTGCSYFSFHIEKFQMKSLNQTFTLSVFVWKKLIYSALQRGTKGISVLILNVSI